MGRGRREGLAALALLVAVGDPTHAARGRGQGGKTDFTVSIPAEALKVETIYLPTQAAITRAELRLDDTVSYDEQPGFPRLPYVLRLVALPAGAEDVRVTVVPRTQTAAGTAPLIEWSQIAQAGGAQSDDVAGAPTHWPAPDQQPIDARVKDAPRWPADEGGLVAIDEAPGYRVARVRVNPVHWAPAGGALTLASDVDVRVEWNAGATRKPSKRYADWAGGELMRRVVVNPEAVPRVELPPLRRTDWPYVILTDDRAWNPATLARLDARPGIADEMQRLADWRTARGLRARVVRVDDVVRGVYGNFQRGGGDLPQVLRRFLQWANRHWSTYWVLLGGDVSIVPARKVFGFGGNCASAYWLAGDAKPPVGRASWDAATSTLRLRHDAVILSTFRLSSMNTGALFTRVTAPSATNPGWAYATDDSYATESATQTNYIVVRGADADVAWASIGAVLTENSIPSDLYYSALMPSSGGGRDWDANGNGVYGQYGWSGTFDGVGYWPVVMVGRAPVETRDEAKAFVDKTIAYEQYAGIPAGFAQKALLTATNWGGGPGVGPNVDDATLEDGEYVHVPGATSARLQFAGAPGGAVGNWRLLARDSGGGSTPIGYSMFPYTGGLNYLWCTSADCGVPSLNLDLFGGPLLAPLPTRFVQVSGPSPDLEPAGYVFDQVGPDGAVTEKEVVRTSFATFLPWLDPPQRLYEDLLDAPGYPGTDLSPITEPAVHAALDTGYNVVSGSGHGWWGGCCGLDYSTVDTLTNGNAGGLIYADSCLTSQFDVDDCVAERMVRAPGGGAVAYVGHTRYVWLGTGPIFERAFWRQMPWSPRLGLALAVTRLLHAADIYQRWGSAALNLIGDPALALWRGDPTVVSLGVDVKRKPRVAFSVTVPQAPPGMTATLTAGGKLITSRWLDANGRATFRPKLRAGTTLQLTVTGDDVVPATTTLQMPRGRK